MKTILQKIVLCFTILLIAFLLLVILAYGHTFGHVKSILFLVTFLMSFGCTVLCVEPLKALAVSVFVVMTVDQHKNRSLEFDGAEDPTADDAVLELEYKWTEYAKLFGSYREKCNGQKMSKGQPLSNSHLTDEQIRLHERYSLYYDTLTSDLLMFTVYLTTLLLVVLGTRDDMSFYSQRLVNDFLVGGKYVRGPHRPVTNESGFWNYLETIVVPTIHPSECNRMQRSI